MPRVSSDQNPALRGVQDVRDLVQRGRGYIAGRSGTGKSNAIKYIHVGLPPTMASIVVNPHGEDVPQSRVVHNTRGIIQALQNGHRKLDWRLPPLETTGQKQVQALIMEFWAWVKSRGPQSQKWLAMMFLEAHRYAPINGPYGPVEAFLCEGRKFGVHTIVESQRPQQVTSEALEQADWMLFFQCKQAGAIYLKSKGIPYFEFEDHVRKPFHSVVVDDGLWTPFIPLPNMD